MKFRFLALALFASLALLAQTQKKASIPRTEDGHPDLQGVWTNATITPLERPAKYKSLTISDAEARQWEQTEAQDLKAEDGASDGKIIRAAGSAGTGGYNALFLDRGSELARVDGVKRTSLIIDPPDGHVPPLTEAAKKRMGEEMLQFFNFDDVKNRPLSERCLIGFGSTAGPPMLPVLYNNNYQIVQTPDTIMILVEMVHDVRVIRMNQQHVASDVKKWLGDSIGRWEGDTLVVDTTNFRPEVRFRGSSENLHVVERFQRIDANTILYRATIEDPTTFTRPWTVEYPFLATAGPVYEYACHEGNYAMQDIMSGARRMESHTDKK
ncbi:MAG TPA: hypothetical protein VKX39_03595 [Bryobacteraceae bacterium]|nr:hypothetical protein [Bryobacteraceae bacterium]